MRIAQGHPAAMLALGAFFLLCAVVCYVVSFTHMERRAENDRNFYVYSTFGLLLALIGTRLMAGEGVLALTWSALALAAAAFGRQTRRVSLKWHGVVYLGAAMAASGLLSDAGARFLGAEGHRIAPFPVWEAVVVLAAAVAAYLFTLRGAGLDGTSSVRPVPSTLFGTGAAVSCAAILAWVITSVCGNIAAGSAHEYCPTYLTSVLAVLAIGLAAIARRAHRPELRWPAFLLAAVATIKILVQDLQRAHTLAIVMSLLIYGAMLVWLPRLLQSPRRPAPR